MKYDSKSIPLFTNENHHFLEITLAFYCEIMRELCMNESKKVAWFESDVVNVCVVETYRWLRIDLDHVPTELYELGRWDLKSISFFTLYARLPRDKRLHHLDLLCHSVDCWNALVILSFTRISTQVCSVWESALVKSFKFVLSPARKVTLTAFPTYCCYPIKVII